MNSPFSYPLSRVWAIWLLFLSFIAVAQGVGVELPKESAIAILAPKPGARFVVPGPVVIEAEAVDPLGDIRHLEFEANGEPIGTSDYLFKIAVIPGRPIPHRLEWKVAKPGTYKLVAWGKDTAGKKVESRAVEIEVTGSPTPTDGVPLVATGATWRYSNDGSNLGRGWVLPNFDDAKWASGPAELGYGDGDEKTATRARDAAPHPITAYFRHRFAVPADLNAVRLSLQLKRDDGAVVYLNGRELIRDNMPAGEITASTLASQSAEPENEFRVFNLEPNALVAGDNLLAVEVHQANVTSSDLSFDLRLSAITSPVRNLPVVSVEATRDATSEPRPEARIAAGEFTFRRTGPADRPLEVLVLVSGSATAGLDYDKLPTFVSFPAGKSETALYVTAMDDALFEGEETVVLELVQPPIPIDPLASAQLPPPPTYLIDGGRSRGRIVIHDADTKPAPWLLNLNFGLWKKKVGPAAIGNSGNDVWNPWEVVGEPDVSSGDLKLADGTAAPELKLRVQNAGGSWNNESGDEMYDSYVYPNSGRGDGVGDILVTLSGIPAGLYDIYLYGHADPGGRPESDSMFSLVSGVQKFGPTGTKSSAGWKVAQGWQNGAQYVLFQRIQVVDGKPLEITVAPGFDGMPKPDQPNLHTAILNGLQLRRVSERPAAATIVLAAPEAGSRFLAGSVIPIRAIAIDPASYINRVEFFDGDRSIGVSEITFVREPDPGTPIEHVLDWRGARVGEHKLSARGKDSTGKVIESAAVPISVGSEPETVLLDVIASDASAKEPEGSDRARTGVFTIRRIDGPKNVAVPVFYSLSGNALNGIDYEKLSGQAEIPAGADAVRVVVTPIADKAIEGDEKVLLELEPPICPAIFPPPPQCYRIGERRSATIVIDDAGIPKNREPEAKIVSPKSGSSFVEGDVIAISAEASDSDGRIERLDIFTGDKLLGSTKESKFTVEWKDASPGAHRISARALDDAGATDNSSTVTVIVRAAEDVAFVLRDLPPAYLPGTQVNVDLLVDPPRGGAAWTVEDVPPAGWTVSEISDEGAFDTVTGRVKFGPFTDASERKLSYRLAAPSSATGVQTFNGRSSLDGRSLPIAGDSKLAPAGELHPADNKAADKSIVADELTAYAAAWKRGRSWGTDSGLIPMTYVARAGQIWKAGEKYRFDPAAGAPPTCWVPGAPRASSLSLAGGNSNSHNGGRGDRIGNGIQKPGAPERVEIDIRPPTGTVAVAVEEVVPAGWTVSDISDDGVYDAASRRIRWGLFFGDTARRVSYMAKAPAGIATTGTWSGWISFDGSEVPIEGLRRIGAVDDATSTRIKGSRREGNGKVKFQIDAPANQILVVEVSDNLKDWTEVGVVVHNGDEVEVQDDDSDRSQHRYYRMRPMGR